MKRPRCTKPETTVPWISILLVLGLVMAYKILPVLIFGPEP
jgi:hypothetical protein